MPCLYIKVGIVSISVREEDVAGPLTIINQMERPFPYQFYSSYMIRARSIVFVLLILAFAISSCSAADVPKYKVGTILQQLHGSGNPMKSYYAILSVEKDTENPVSIFGGQAWVYDLLRIYQYPSGGKWYALDGEQPHEGAEDGLYMDAGYSYYDTGMSTDVNSLPRESTILKLPPPKYQDNDIVRINGYYDSNGYTVHMGGDSVTYSIINGYMSSEEGDQGYYSTSEIRQKADGSWGYIRNARPDYYYNERRYFESGVIQFVTHLSDRQGIEDVAEFPAVVPVTTVVPVITTLIPIKIDTPAGPSTLPPTPVRTEGPSSNPFNPVNTPTPIPTIVTIQTTLPVPVAPIAPLPTAQPTFRFGKRYAVGDPGTFLGTKYGSGDTTTVTKRSRSVTGSDTVLKPGSRSYGITPPVSGSFVRWYPAARWAAGIK